MKAFQKIYKKKLNSIFPLQAYQKNVTFNLKKEKNSLILDGEELAQY